VKPFAYEHEGPWPTAATVVVESHAPTDAELAALMKSIARQRKVESCNDGSHEPRPVTFKLAADSDDSAFRVFCFEMCCPARVPAVRKWLAETINAWGAKYVN
jgi:hypothetical protein